MTDHDLVTFIRARLDEDRRLAIKAHAATENVQGVAEWYRSSTDGIGVTGTNNMILTDGHGFLDEHISDHVVAHQPTRVLRGVEAKRQLIAEFVNAYQQSTRAGLELALRIAATEWSTHHDYQQEWTL